MRTVARVDSRSPALHPMGTSGHRDLQSEQTVQQDGEVWCETFSVRSQGAWMRRSCGRQPQNAIVVSSHARLRGLRARFRGAFRRLHAPHGALHTASLSEGGSSRPR